MTFEVQLLETAKDFYEKNENSKQALAAMTIGLKNENSKPIFYFSSLTYFNPRVKNFRKNHPYKKYTD